MAADRSRASRWRSTRELPVAAVATAAAAAALGWAAWTRLLASGGRQQLGPSYPIPAAPTEHEAAEPPPALTGEDSGEVLAQCEAQLDELEAALALLRCELQQDMQEEAAAEEAATSPWIAFPSQRSPLACLRAGGGSFTRSGAPSPAEPVPVAGRREMFWGSGSPGPGAAPSPASGAHRLEVGTPESRAAGAQQQQQQQEREEKGQQQRRRGPGLAAFQQRLTPLLLSGSSGAAGGGGRVQAAAAEPQALSEVGPASAPGPLPSQRLFTPGPASPRSGGGRHLGGGSKDLERLAKEWLGSRREEGGGDLIRSYHADGVKNLKITD